MTMWLPNLSEAGGPVYRQIAQAIREAVKDGSLKPGDRLPTHRDLAYHLGVTVGTITRSYREAERLGLVAGEVGRGTYVLDNIQSELDMAATAPIPMAFTNNLAQMGRKPAFAHGAADDSEDTGPINFRMNCPLPPQEGHIRQTLLEIAGTMPIDDMVSYKSEYGVAHQREALAHAAGRVGLDDNPERVLPTAGVQHGMTVSLLATVRPGDLVLCEELTYPNLRSLANLLQFRLRGVAMDDQGILPEALENICRTQSPRAIYLMPTLHNPLCSTMDQQRRIEIAEILRKYDLTLIEDGIYHFLDPDAPPPLSCFAPERSIYLDGVSKSIGGGLRVGYIHAPGEMIGKLASAIRSTCWMVSTINLELVTRMIMDGSLAQYEAWHRNEAAQRLAVILGTLKGYDVRFHPTNYHIWLELPDHIDPGELVMNAANSGVLLTAAQQFSVGHVPRGLRLCFGAERSAERLRRGVQIVDRLLKSSDFGNAAVI
ncbi:MULTISPECIES: aminotransferase-like domain-containing protein [Thalassospira]|jgi:DNA-binding transcriptional MocR family regulator|uniref:PLP-dependent aminotransferase family protein n=1 Tax=Thalassospira povalilytica TaxID=732237 RepID=A0A8I1SK50_9PROT|nr:MULTISPECIES: PLP-dependent aminotransferase family protein [Thalassospira]MBN8197066.1 PLP-dependent aminotransferase family protein [Thalassospira povalilytica]MCC4240462.1 PLP-dependent aminotransferase family protein [Thalassospira povalilytica]PKR50999.1 PLP-dependent aminotransferase family protein [Thalassospira povalilytica]URK18488.1 PLP-dependent aminotransferase family protein [Thalassospira sp. GO-4]